MAALNTAHPNLQNVTSRLAPDGSIDDIVELLTKKNPAIRDASWMESNGITGHRSTVRTSKPTPGWRRLNEVSSFDKSTTAQITDTIGILEKWYQVDERVARLNGNSMEWRASEEAAFVEAMADEMEDTLFNGNETTEPEAFTGFGPRFNTVTSVENAENIFNESSGDTDATSIWLIDWNPSRVFMLFPKGSRAGLEINDDGLVTAETHAGQTGPIKVYRTRYVWDAGLCVKDWRAVSRFQFDPDDVVASGSSGPILADTMRKMIRRVKPGPQARWYMNRDAMDMFDLQGNHKGTLAIPTVTGAQGELVESFLGIPIRQCDAITTGETSIT